MAEKFIAFQIGLVILGIVLFLGLADLKKRMMEKKAAEQEVVLVEKECPYDNLVGQTFNVELVEKIERYPIVLPYRGEDTPDPQLSKEADNDIIIIYTHKDMKVAKITCP